MRLIFAAVAFIAIAMSQANPMPRLPGPQPTPWKETFVVDIEGDRAYTYIGARFKNPCPTDRGMTTLFESIKSRADSSPLGTHVVAQVKDAPPGEMSLTGPFYKERGQNMYVFTVVAPCSYSRDFVVLVTAN